MLILLGSTSGLVKASTPELLIRVLPVADTNSSSPGPISIQLISDAIEEIVVSSALVSAQTDAVFAEALPVGKGIINPSTSEIGDHAVSTDAVEIAGNGDVVTLPTAHVISLSPGLYAERLDVTLLVNGSVVELADYRYLAVSDGGTTTITAEEYSNAAVETVIVNGSREVVGGVAPLPTNIDASLRKGDAILVALAVDKSGPLPPNVNGSVEPR